MYIVTFLEKNSLCLDATQQKSSFFPTRKLQQHWKLNSYMHYNVISSPCIPDSSPLASAIFWAHMNVTTIIWGKKGKKQTLWIQNLQKLKSQGGDGVLLVVATAYNSNTKIIAVSKDFTCTNIHFALAKFHFYFWLF